MKTIENRKREHRGGFVSYYMKRAKPGGRVFSYVLNLSPAEVSNGRPYIAARLRQVRLSIRRSMQD